MFLWVWTVEGLCFELLIRRSANLCSGNDKDMCAIALTRSVPVADPGVGAQISQERSL